MFCIGISISAGGMRRGTIFEIASGELDLTDTIHEIAELFEEKRLVRAGYFLVSLEKAVGEDFIDWESGGKYTDLYQFKKR